MIGIENVKYENPDYWHDSAIVCKCGAFICEDYEIGLDDEQICDECKKERIMTYTKLVNRLVEQAIKAHGEDMCPISDSIADSIIVYQKPNAITFWYNTPDGSTHMSRVNL